MTPIDELKENLLRKQKQKHYVISIDYVLKKLKEAQVI